MNQIIPTFNYYGQNMRKDVWKKVRLYLPGHPEGLEQVIPHSFDAVRDAIQRKHEKKYILTVICLETLGADLDGEEGREFQTTHWHNMSQDLQIEVTAALQLY